jgi:hypothetical protein
LVGIQGCANDMLQMTLTYIIGIMVILYVFF